jgi:hypothetical protein
MSPKPPEATAYDDLPRSSFVRSGSRSDTEHVGSWLTCSSAGGIPRESARFEIGALSSPQAAVNDISIFKCSGKSLRTCLIEMRNDVLVLRGSVPMIRMIMCAQRGYLTIQRYASANVMRITAVTKLLESVVG